MRVPRLKLKKLNAQVGSLKWEFKSNAGEVVTATMVNGLADKLKFPLKVSEENLRGTLVQLISRKLTPELIDFISRQLVARNKELKRGALRVPDSVVVPEWAPLEIVAASPCEWQSGKAGQLLTFYCLGGKAAGFCFRRKFPQNWLSFLAYKLGFTRRLQYQYDPTTLIGFRLWAFIVPGDEVDLKEWNISSEMQKYNKLIIYKRTRFERDGDDYDDDGNPTERTCQLDYKHECKECPRSASECPASVIRLPFDKRLILCLSG